MPAPTVFDESDGYLDVTFQTRDNSPVDVRLDLYEAHDALNSAVRVHSEAGDGAIWRAWGEWLGTQGAPPLSFAEMYRLNATIGQHIAEYKKKVLGSLSEPESPAPSECPSTPAPSPS